MSCIYKNVCIYEHIFTHRDTQRYLSTFRLSKKSCRAPSCITSLRYAPPAICQIRRYQQELSDNHIIISRVANTTRILLIKMTAYLT